jgi:glycogen(starch) synthase
MDNLDNGFLAPSFAPPQTWPSVVATVPAGRLAVTAPAPAPQPGPSPEVLRQHAWEIGERRWGEAYVPPAGHVGLAAVTPHEAFIHWRILHDWVEQTARQKGGAWDRCRMIVRLYDVSFIEFNGFNAHSLRDYTIQGLCGEMLFKLSRPGSWHLAEVGFLLRSGEFLPAARSGVVAFPPERASGRGDHAALLVVPRPHTNGRVLHVEPISNVWDQGKVLADRRRPRLRKSLRIAAFTLAPPPADVEAGQGVFLPELTAGQVSQGYDVHVFAPASDGFVQSRQVGGTHYHPLEMAPADSPVELARAFGQAAERRLEDFPPFDLIHLHEWQTGLGPWTCTRPAILSLTSTEATRRNGGPVSELSREVEQAERECVRAARCVLVPVWLRDRAITDLGLEADRVLPFPMEGRMPNEWEYPLDYGAVKREVGVGPLDRVILFVGPLEHGAGPDLLIEALPSLLNRYPNLRLLFAGAGNLHGSMQWRAHQLGVGHAVRLLGHVEQGHLTRLLRAAEALALPSRHRVPFDDAVVDLARKAGRPVFTTQGGPAHLVRHEENGLVTYDNPGSMVWAMDRILGAPEHAQRMGQKGRRNDAAAPRWSEVATHYLELCAACFPELTEPGLL